MPTRDAVAVWNGTLQEGNGTVTIAHGTIEHPFTFKSRFEEAPETNPEELLGAAHAGCFSMALGARLGRAGHNVHYIRTVAKVHLDKVESGFKITQIDLETEGKVEGIDAAAFTENAEATKDTCIVSQALSAVPMTIKATLVS
jgi:lipoyl-dependent peroxiredoxin